jgi:hypothetical protein
MRETCMNSFSNLIKVGGQGGRQVKITAIMELMVLVDKEQGMECLQNRVDKFQLVAVSTVVGLRRMLE